MCAGLLKNCKHLLVFLSSTGIETQVIEKYLVNHFDVFCVCLYL